MGDQDAGDVFGRNPRGRHGGRGMAHRRAPGRAGAGIHEGEPVRPLQHEAVHGDADLRLAPTRDRLVAGRFAIGMDEDIERRLEDAVMQDRDLVGADAAGLLDHGCSPLRHQTRSVWPGS